jgi:PhnB protein
MTQINAYLNFDGNCREAMNFYRDSLGGELALQTIEGSPLENECPGAMRNQVLHASLVNEGILLMGSDMKGPEGFIKGNTIALSLQCSSEIEIQEFFSNLSRDGKIMHGLTETSWGATFGILVDKFGIRWMLNYDRKQEA